MEFTQIIPWAFGAVAFLIGSIPFGLLIARVFKVRDLQSRGSGNIGATNVSRVLGFWPAGFLTLLLDLLKGSVPVLLVKFPGLWTQALGIGDYEPSLKMVWGVGLCAVLGHCYSPWLYFKGGKGVATGLGVILILTPWAALVGVLGFILAFLSKKIGSLASISGLLVASVTHLVIQPMGAHLWAGVAIIFVVLLRHEANLDALLENRENIF